MNCKEFLNRLFGRENTVCKDYQEENSPYEDTYISSFINENKDDFDDCVICLEKMERGDTLSTLNCFHIYHKKCIYAWSQKNRICPICDYKF
tara:strand:+ start:11222 stop:11497 length:276 start_codon:yes stop_codon:yes gene_type:complete